MTATPRTDALMLQIGMQPRDRILFTDLNVVADLARQLERDLARANADKARLLAATETAITELTTLLPRLTGSYAVNVGALIGHLRAALAQS